MTSLVNTLSVICDKNVRFQFCTERRNSHTALASYNEIEFMTVGQLVFVQLQYGLQLVSLRVRAISCL